MLIIYVTQEQPYEAGDKCYRLTNCFPQFQNPKECNLSSFRGKFVMIQLISRNKKKFHMNNLTLNVKELEKEERSKTKNE